MIYLKPNSKVQLGRQVEDLMVRHCRKLDWVVLSRNYKKRGGELDLVCYDQQQIIFVEVKGRRSTKFGVAGDQLSPRQLRRIWLTAQKYLTIQGLLQTPWRIDFMALQRYKNCWHLRHYKNLNLSDLHDIHY